MMSVCEVCGKEYYVNEENFICIHCELVTTLNGGTFLFLCIFMLFQSATF